jgi:hypothetical protein
MRVAAFRAHPSLAVLYLRVLIAASYRFGAGRHIGDSGFIQYKIRDEDYGETSRFEIN